jgi:molybdopterin synthase catalytic subunit
MRISVQDTPFDIGLETTGFTEASAGIGAVVTFTGIVRDTEGTLRSMQIEHYPGMTEKALEKIANEASERWSLGDVLIIHRHGNLSAGEAIMMVATASAHRKDAFEAAEFLMDYLKSRAPFWKKEDHGEGRNWVAAKDDDEAALDRWAKPTG